MKKFMNFRFVVTLVLAIFANVATYAQDNVVDEDDLRLVVAAQTLFHALQAGGFLHAQHIGGTNVTPLA